MPEITSDTYYVNDPRNDIDRSISKDEILAQIQDYEARCNAARELEKQFEAHLSALGFFLDCEGQIDTYQSSPNIDLLRKKLQYGPWPQIKRNRLVDLLDGQLERSTRSLADLIAQDLFG